MKKATDTFDWKTPGKIILITIGIILLIEFGMYFLGIRGGNIARVILGKSIV